MSKAEEKADKAHPINKGSGIDRIISIVNRKNGYIQGYIQSEKDTLDRVCKWIEENATYINPRTGIKTCVVNLNALREAMK